jgi:hypothetical protein
VQLFSLVQGKKAGKNKKGHRNNPKPNDGGNFCDPNERWQGNQQGSLERSAAGTTRCLPRGATAEQGRGRLNVSTKRPLRLALSRSTPPPRNACAGEASRVEDYKCTEKFPASGNF